MKSLGQLAGMIRLPLRVWNRAVREIRGPVRYPIPNIAGDRDIEWSWVAAHLPVGPGLALDFGSGGSSLALVAAMRSYKVTAIDLQEPDWLYEHPNLGFQRQDVLDGSLQSDVYDVVINCSSIEHVGLAGRYGVIRSSPDGDLQAMAELRRAMKPRGLMIMTIPVGQDEIFPPMARVYGSSRLPLLLDGLTVVEEVYWIKNDHNEWIMSERGIALARPCFAGSPYPLANRFGLGCFLLRKAA